MHKGFFRIMLLLFYECKVVCKVAWFDSIRHLGRVMVLTLLLYRYSPVSSQ